MDILKKNLSACSKTFGLKNKNKSAKVQQYVQQVQQQTKGQTAQKGDEAAVKKVRAAEGQASYEYID